MNDLVHVNQFTEISGETMQQLLAIAQLADHVSAHAAFADYQSLKAASTLQAQQKDLENFTDYLNEIYEQAGLAHRLLPEQLFSQPEAWVVVSAGLVETFKKQLAAKGFALSSINRALATIRTYAKLALKAGVLDSNAYVHIKAVGGYRGTEAVNFNEKREVTRIGRKKAESVVVDIQVVKELKKLHQDTPMGRRDRLILCLIFDHGLRASEVAGLRVGDIDMVAGKLRVYRKKTKTTDTLKMTLDTQAAAKGYLEKDALAFANEPLFLSASRWGGLKTKPMNRVAVSQAVNRHGKRMAKQYGLEKLKTLSAHDGRSQWTTDAISAGTPLTAVQDAGGWQSPEMVHRYAKKAKIANKDVVLNR
jgi:integrase